MRTICFEENLAAEFVTFLLVVLADFTQKRHIFSRVVLSHGHSRYLLVDYMRKFLIFTTDKGI